MKLLDVLYRHLPTTLVFLTLGGLAWFYGGMRAEPLLNGMPWLMALTFEALLFFPQKRPYEDIYEARGRLWRKMTHDPLFFVTLTFLVLLVIPLFNHGLCPNCDASAIAAGQNPNPTVPFLPYSVNTKDHVHVMTWFVPSLLAMLAARYVLLREGKRVLLEMMVWNAVALAVFGFIEQGTGATFVFWEKPAHPVYFFSVFGYPNAAGCFFTMMFAFAIGLWRYHARETELLEEANRDRRTVGPSNYWLRAHYMLVAVVLLLFAVLYTRSRAAVMFAAVLSAATGLYITMEALGHRVQRARRLKTIIFSAVGLLVVGITVLIFSPKEISAEMKTADLAAIADRVTGKTEWHVTAAWEIFKEHPFFGVGGWGYKHYCLPYVPESARRSFGKWYSRGGANVHNDHLQFLCEHGAVGLVLLLAMVILLMWPTCRIWARLYKASLFMRGDKVPPRPKAIFALPAAAFWVFAGTICALVHAFADCPFRCAAVMSTFLTALVCAEGFVPRIDELDRMTVDSKGSSDARSHEGRHSHHRDL